MSKLYLPTQVVSGDIENFSAQSYKLVNWIYDYRSRNPKTADISNAGGWQSECKWFYDEEESFTPWMELIKQELIELLGHYRLERSIAITSMWININPKYSYNNLHTHTPSNLSGVFWIKVPPNSGDFVFEIPSYFDNKIIESTDLQYREEINLHGGINEYVKEGRMIIFPSGFPHRVGLNLSDEDRISIAFNLSIN